MRITRSGLRRIIAEESARILAETKKRDQSPRDRLAAYLDRVGADSAAIMRAVDRAVDRAHEEGSEVTSEDVTFNLSNKVLAAIPEDDSDRWHSMLDAVLADEIDPDAFADAERDRQDVEDTERDLSHPSNFLEEMKKKKPSWQVAAEKGGKDCLYILYGGRSVFYIVAPSGLTEEEAEAQAIEVTGDIAGDEEMANPLELYEWLADHDFITAVYDIESAGGEVSKAAFMEQLREVGEEEGLFASDDDEFVNEGEDDALDEYGDPDDSDPEGGQMNHGVYASRDELDYLRGGGSYTNSPYADLDVPNNAYTRGRAKGFGKSARVRGADVDSGYDDADDMGDNLSEGRWSKLAGILSEGVDDDRGGAASASDSGDREGRRGEHLGDDPDMGPPGHDDWHIDTYEDEDIEGSDFDEMIDPADDNDDPMNPAWMRNDPYADTAPDDLTLADDPYVGGRAASAAIRQKYSETGDSDPEDDRSLPRGHRYGVSGGWGGLDEARWAKLAGVLKD
jgi:hypothetical protein